MNTVPSIKTATQAAINRIGSIDAAASVVRVGRSQLSEYQSRNSSSVVPADVAITLDEFAQEPLILSAMAQAEGFMLMPVHLGESNGHHGMDQVAAKASATMTHAIEALADGKYDQMEAALACRDLTNLIRVAHSALHALRPIAKGGQG